MTKSLFGKYFALLGIAFGVWIGIRYALPVLFPFLLGGALALAAEPMVGLLHRRLKFPRSVAAAVGVTLGFILLIALLVILAALLVRQASRLAGILPDLTEAARNGLGSLEGGLLSLAQRTPEGVRGALKNSVTKLFSDSSTMMDRVVEKLPGAVSGFFGWFADGALGFAAGLLSAFMISARLPELKQFFTSRIPRIWTERYLPALKGMKAALFGWLFAQIKLAGVTGAVLLAGFWILQIPYAPVWALVVALVDAFPILGTGTVLIPWSLICLLQGQQVRGIGLLGVYGVVWLIRSVLEPKLLGKELGLDPLVTLIAMYAGVKLFGFLGMLLAPLLAVAAVRLRQPFSSQTNAE